MVRKDDIVGRKKDVPPSREFLVVGLPINPGTMIKAGFSTLVFTEHSEDPAR